MNLCKFNLIKIALWGCFAFFSCFSFGQVRIVGSSTNTVISSSSAFIDASSNATNNGSSNIGKGILFPRTDLTLLTAVSPTTGGIASNYPTRFDGMIVYNTVTGNAGIGGTAVSPGFYYYYNPGTHKAAEGNSNQGIWMRIADATDLGSGAKKVYYGQLATNAPAATDIKGLSSSTIESGTYDGKFDLTLASTGYYTIAVPVSWRNPMLTIDGSETFNIFLPLKILVIDGLSYQVWQSDVQLTSGLVIAVN